MHNKHPKTLWTAIYISNIIELLWGCGGVLTQFAVYDHRKALKGSKRDQKPQASSKLYFYIHCCGMDYEYIHLSIKGSRYRRRKNENIKIFSKQRTPPLPCQLRHQKRKQLLNIYFVYYAIHSLCGDFFGV